MIKQTLEIFKQVALSIKYSLSPNIPKLISDIVYSVWYVRYLIILI